MAHIFNEFTSKIQEYVVLLVIEFDSTRKRSSVVCMKQPDDGSDPDKVMIFCKGADSIIEPLLSPANEIEEVIGVKFFCFQLSATKLVCIGV